VTTIRPISVEEDSVALTHYSLSQQGDRTYNEDAYCHVRDDGIVSFAVADGMGGASGGMQASAIAMSAVREHALTLDANDLSQQFVAISSAIKHAQQTTPEHSGMCTTIAELRIDTYSQQAIWAHWGDTRIYWFRENELVSVTEDHSVVQSLVTAGLLSQEEAARYSKRNVLLGAAGATCEVEPCVLAAPVPIADGDAFLICTDGVWSMVDTPFIEQALSQAISVQDWIDAIMKQVAIVGHGSNDNFTATGVWVTSGDEKTISMAL